MWANINGKNNYVIFNKVYRCCNQKLHFSLPYSAFLIKNLNIILPLIVGATVSDFGLPWDLLAEIDFLV